MWRVAPFVNGAPSALMLAHLREAAIDFCTRTLVWRETLPPVLTAVDDTTYAIPLPQHSALVKLISYTLQDRDRRDIVDAGEGELRLSDGDATESAWTEDRVNFRVSPAPKVAGWPMVLTVALKPSDSTVMVPSFILNQHAATIAAGAIARLSSIPRQSFTDLQQAEIQSGIYNLQTKRLALAASRGFGRNTRRTSVVWF